MSRFMKRPQAMLLLMTEWQGLKTHVERHQLKAELLCYAEAHWARNMKILEMGLKVDVGPGYRIYVADNGRDSLILCAGSKRTQKQDTKAAKSYWADWKTREGEWALCRDHDRT